MNKFSVTGMSCAACAARVESAVSKVEGVTSCAVNLLTNSMGVEGSASPEEIILAVEKAGYGASNADRKDSLQTGETKSEEEALKDRESPVLFKRLISSLVILSGLLYVSMGHSMWNFPLPEFFQGNYMALGLVELILSAVILLINKKFFISGFKGLVHLSPNMDSLVAMGSGVSFLYSLTLLFLMTKSGDSQKAAGLFHGLYFESAAMIVSLITLGKLLESISKGKTTDALKSLMKLAPQTAVILSDGKEVEVPVGQVKPGDIFIVRPGSRIPVDGQVIQGNSCVNESALTGEGIPVDKKEGDTVSAATVNESGFIKCRALRVGEDTALSQIIRMVSDASATKAPIAKIADKVSGIFVPSVILIGIITFTVWLILGKSLDFALARGISVLVVSCPCALGLATPVAIMVGNGKAAKNGILFKTAASLESLGRTKIIALDKTGTITKGQPFVVSTRVLDSQLDEKGLFQYGVNLESLSEHPLAKAVLKKAEELGITGKPVENFQAIPGLGLSGRMNLEDGSPVEILGGNLDFISGKLTGDQCEREKALLQEEVKQIAGKGQTPLIFAMTKDSKTSLLGIISVADVIKEDSRDALVSLKKLGIKSVMLTGDSRETGMAIAEQAGVEKVIAGILPKEKAETVMELQKQGRVAMVGDGINDGPALTCADTGIAVGAGTDVAIDAADVVVVRSRLTDVVNAMILSRKTIRNIRQNLFWAFAYNVALIPVAAGLYASLGLTMNPMFGAAAMSLSSFCVVTNALRLNFVKLNESKISEINEGDSSGNKISKVESEKESKMTKTINVEGMMCSHCEAHVKEALEKIPGVDKAVASHEKNQVVLEISGQVADSQLEEAVTGAGYTYKG